MEEKSAKKRKVAWGVTGSGDQLVETIEVVKQAKIQFEQTVEVQVYLSKAASTVLKYYRLNDELKASFERVYTEVDANTPFLAGWLQQHKFEFLLIAPATSNTVAKIAGKIGDTMLTNAAAMGLKALVPIYIMPTDFQEGTASTRLPKGEVMRLHISREDAEKVRKIAKMRSVFIITKPEEIRAIFRKHFGT